VETGPIVLLIACLFPFEPSDILVKFKNNEYRKGMANPAKRARAILR